MYDSWEEFEGTPLTPHSMRLHVSLNYKGQIFLNKRAYEAMGSPAAVVLLCSRPTNKIALRPARADVKNAFPVKPRYQAHSKMIMASPFCRNYGIKVDGTVAFQNIQIDNEGMMTLDLSKTTRISRIIRKLS